MSQTFAIAFGRFLACLLQQIISKMKLFMPAALMPEIALRDAWSDAPRRFGDAGTQPGRNIVKPS
jgi:hypothetical protein